MSLAQDIAKYEADRARYGVPVGEGMCIAEDHTGHAHVSQEFMTLADEADDRGAPAWVSRELRAQAQG